MSDVIWQDIFAGVILLLIIPSTLVANVLQIRALIQIKKLLSVSELPVLNISVIGILMALYSLPVYVIVLFNNQVLKTEWSCGYLLISLYFPQQMLTWGHLLMAFESFLSVVYPVFHRRPSGMCVVKYAIFVNVLICICGTISFILSSEIPQDVTVCAVYTLRLGQRNMKVYISTFILTMIFPTLTTVVFYVKIAKVAHSRIAPRGATPQNTFHLKRSRIMCMVFVTSSLMWLPYFFYVLVNSISGRKHVAALMPVLSVTNFNLFNTFIIYLIKSLRFREKVKNLICCCLHSPKAGAEHYRPYTIS